MSQVQNFENHTKLVPAFHFVAVPILFLNFIWSVWRAIQHFAFGTVVSSLVGWRSSFWR